MNNKKIGIITLHKNVNFGANLQAFASYRYLIGRGCKAQLIDYMPANQDKVNHLFGWLYESWKNGKTSSPVHNLKLFCALVLSAPNKNKRLRAFSSFRKKYIDLTPYCKNEKEVASLGFDAIVCGSDQIWNPEITQGVEPLFFGKISGIPLKISYAASMGRDKFDEPDEAAIGSLIKQMDYVSVREEKSKTYAEQLSGKTVECVCDPVFLLSKSDYEQLLPKPLNKGKYILLYSVVTNSAMTQIAKQYAKSKGLELIEICQEKKRGSSHTQLCGLGPLEFLNYFCYAETIITNSFHGTAFSLIFEKDFYAVDNKAKGSRITNLLEKAHLTERMIETPIEKDLAPIDYSAVKDNMRDYIESSKLFLENALSVEKKLLLDKNCTGCGACTGVCAKEAISMVADKEGFFKAYIDSGKCCNCSLCQSVCPSLNSPEKQDFKQGVFAFKANDNIRKTSTSGGAFSALSEEILKSGGAVYAAGIYDKSGLSHVRCKSSKEIAKTRGVKYIQSDFSSCYAQVEKDLKDGKAVLVTGTPCQIAGMKSFANVKKLPTENLYLADIICHGIPSPAVFSQFLLWLEEKYGCNVNKYHFRNKDISWRGNSCRAELSDGRVIDNTRELSCFMNLYYSGNITNECCYSCPYTETRRISDITFSDYWGLENLDTKFEDKLGVSMVLVNSPKGKALFDSCQGERIDGNLNCAKQPQLHAPCEKPIERDVFYKEYFSKDMETVFKKYAGYQKVGLFQKAKSKIKRLISK